MRNAILTWLFCFISTGAMVAQGPLTATLDSSHMLIGSRIHIRLELPETKGFVPLTAKMDGLDTMGAIEILGEPEWTFDRDQWNAQLGITAFDTGYYLLPPVSVSGTSGGETVTYHSKRLPLLVEAVPIDTSGVKPIRPIVEEPVNWTDFKWLLAGVGVIALIALLVWLIRRIKRSDEEAEPYIPPKEAHIVALEKLEQLEQAQLWQNGQVKAYYVQLGDILREYFENRFLFRALEMTTGELKRALKEREELRIYADPATEFFGMADMVKFAKAKPDEQVHRDWMIWVRELIVATQESTEPDGTREKETEV